MCKTAKEHYRTNKHLQQTFSKINYMLYGFVQALNINSIFEFGCNCGRHINALLKLGDYKIKGIDINEGNIHASQKIFGLECTEVGDENTLKDIPDNSYDFVFTNSVLDHMPEQEFEIAINELIRMSKKYIMLIETNDKSIKGRWYKHDYLKYGAKVVFWGYSKDVDAVYEAFLIKKL